MIGIRLLGLGSGEPTPYDGQWLMEYDPRRPSVDPDGRPMLAHLVCTDDPSLAMRFETAAHAYAVWRAASGHRRRDGGTDRPLTAFTISLEKLD